MTARTKRPEYKVNSGWWLLRDMLTNGRPEFNADSASLRGRRITYAGEIHYGIMPDRTELSQDRDLVDYVIYSYQTPIAWHVVAESCKGDGHWVMPETKYSVTTSKHQGRVGTALSQL